MLGTRPDGGRAVVLLILARPIGGRPFGRAVGAGCEARSVSCAGVSVATHRRRGWVAAGGLAYLNLFVTGGILKKTEVARRQ